MYLKLEAPTKKSMYDNKMTTNLQTTQTILYKLDSNNKIREWCAWTENCSLIIRYGLLNGAKSFETLTYNSADIAEEHKRRRITKQQNRKGYTTEIPETRILMPMLAHRWQDHFSKMPDKVIIQPKLNGYRCLGTKTSMKTRTNFPLPAFPHIQYCLSFLPDDIILDGEIYNHNSRFQHIMKSKSLISSQDSLMLEYHVFDCVENMPFHARKTLVSEAIVEMRDQYEKKPFFAFQQPLPFPIVPVKSESITLPNVKKINADYTSQGYEGVMIRNPDSTYEVDTRSYNLLKYKERDQDYYKIVDVVPGPKRKNEGVFICALPNGRTFKCTIKGTQYDKIQYLRKPTIVIGKFALIEYLGFTDDDLPSHAIAIQIH